MERERNEQAAAQKQAAAERAEMKRRAALFPELLEALKRCIGSLRTVSPGGDGDPDVEFARAAIAKAEGK